MGSAEYKQRHREQGLCVECSRPAFLPHIRCVEHLHVNNVKYKKYYQKNKKRLDIQFRKMRQEWKDSGKCSRCGNILDDDADKGYSRCQNCREQL